MSTNMDIKSLILAKIKQNGKVKSAEIVKQTGFSRAYVHKVLRKLQDQGRIVSLGRANKARYVLADPRVLEKEKKGILAFSGVFVNKDLVENTVLSNIVDETGIFYNLQENVSKIIKYAFLEMVNNAIEHSRSEKIKVKMEIEKDVIGFVVQDMGIGIYNNLIQKKHLNSELEAIQELMKGKQTTDPEHHSGEGIFFTSKVGDSFIIKSGTKKLRFNNLIEDVSLESSSPLEGTFVEFHINLDSDRKMNDVFEKYTDDAFDFSKTGILVRLYKLGSELISRSEARRILTGLDEFKEIILDFTGMDSIGQAFADEVFRVYHNANPDKKIIYTNANEDVEFMIKRAK